MSHSLPFLLLALLLSTACDGPTRIEQLDAIYGEINSNEWAACDARNECLPGLCSQRPLQLGYGAEACIEAMKYDLFMYYRHSSQCYLLYTEQDLRCAERCDVICDGEPVPDCQDIFDWKGPIPAVCLPPGDWEEIETY